MKRVCILLIVALITLVVSYSYAQGPTSPIQQIGLPNKGQYPIGSSRLPTRGFNSEAQRTAIMQEVQAHQQQLKEKENQEETLIQNEIQRQNDINMLAKYGFPSQSANEGTNAFYDAYDEINEMLNGKHALDLGRTVFLVENAWHDNKYDYEGYKAGIKASVDFCNEKIEEEKLDKNDNLVKNMMLFRFIADTLKVKDRATKKTLTHYPIKYNYDDYQSTISYDSHFVTTLMQTGQGQCHSMPLYYLVLAEEIGADAYWAFSPRHSFVKIQDEKGVWYNLELTCKAILSDTHYMNSSYMKAEALQNKIYLEPMDKTNVVAEMMLDLARAYYQKYGYDDFYLKCVNTAEQYLKNNLNALMLRSAYETKLTLLLAHLLKATKPDIMKELSPESYKHFELMQAQYKQIDDMGYEEIPIAIYGLWLNHIAKEKEKSEKAKMPSVIIIKDKERLR